MHRFFREPVEGNNSHLNVLLFCVLDFVVAYAVQTLNKHHDGGHASGGRFGGIVKRAAGHAMRLSAGFPNRNIAKFDQVIVKRTR